MSKNCRWELRFGATVDILHQRAARGAMYLLLYESPPGMKPNGWQCQPRGGRLRAKGSYQRAGNAVASARTFGAKRSRGLPPDRWPCQPPGGRLRAKGSYQRAGNAVASARTFGAERSRGLSPDRSVHSRMAGACGRRTLPGPWGYPHDPALACCSGP